MVAVVAVAAVEEEEKEEVEGYFIVPRASGGT
jgi:hypothetical protein